MATGSEQRPKNRKMFSFTLHTIHDKEMLDFIEKHGTTMAVKMAMKAYLQSEKENIVDGGNELSERQLEQIVEALQRKNIFAQAQEEQSATIEPQKEETKHIQKVEENAAVAQTDVDEETRRKAEEIMREKGNKIGNIKLG